MFVLVLVTVSNEIYIKYFGELTTLFDEKQFYTDIL